MTLDEQTAHVMIEVTLEEVKLSGPPTYQGYCPHCSRMNVKAHIIGHYDDWAVECPGCHRVNHVGQLHFSKLKGS